MENTVIKAENVSKKYCRSLKHVMLYGVQDIARNTLGMSSRSEQLRDGEFWAANDVSFEVRRGETLGIIGPNGSGKSTMLKLINGIFMPDKGRIEIKGRIGALIEVGAGFHPMLTGRENIYVNGAILGMSKKEINRKFDEIVEFADIGEFIDAPVKHYSSGMVVRLGFSIAAYCEPDILLIDEVLAVGDIFFQNKCLKKIFDLYESGDTTIVFVSHDMNAVRLLCQKCLLLKEGKKLIADTPSKVVENFAGMIFSQKKTFESNNLKMSMINEKHEVVSELDCRSPYSLILELIDVHIESSLLLAISFVNQETKFNYRLESAKFKNIKGRISKKINVSFNELNLPRGTYTIRFAISDGNFINRKYHIEETIYFSIKDSFKSPKFLQADWRSID